MKAQPGSRLFSDLKLCSQGASWVVILLGCLGLAGWIFKIDLLKNVFPGLPLMVPNTAIAFVLAGFSLSLLRVETAGMARRRTAQACAFAVTLIGALTLFEYLFDQKVGIDQLLFGERLSKLQTPFPGRPAFLTALNSLFLGLALLLLDAKSRYGSRAVELLTVAAILISLLALIGYACNVPTFYAWRSLFPGTGMALHTSVAFTALGAGILCARPDRGLLGIVTSPTASGMMARRLILAPVLIPLMTGLLKVAGLGTGLYNAEVVSWMFAFSNIAIFTAAIWWSASLLHRAEIVRRGAEEDAQKANTELEQRVSERTAELSQAVTTLQESEERVRLVLDTALDAVITIDQQGAVTSWNREAEKMFGWTHQEIIGRKLSDSIIPPVHREAHERGMRHFLATREGPVLNKRIEITALHREGREFPVELCIAPIRLGGNFIFSAFIEDITERKAAKEALARERNLLRLLIDNLPACIYVKDPEGRFLVYNAASVRLVGATSEASALGKTVFDFFPPEIARLYDADDRGLLASGQPVLDREEPTQDRDGNRRWFLTTKLPLRDSRAVTIGLLGISQDITERKRAEEEIKQRATELERFHRLSVGRELRMVELKKEVNELVKQAGRTAPYDLSFLEVRQDAGQGRE